MVASVGIKSPKKITAAPRELLQSLMALESACVRILDSRIANESGDPDDMLHQQHLKNIATPVSLALREYKGPRHFHQHYRHSPDDHDTLYPVLEDALATLAHACGQAVRQCGAQLVGIQNETLDKQRQLLEKSLNSFLECYAETPSETV